MAKQATYPNTTGSGGILVSVFDKGSQAPLENASVSLWRLSAAEAANAAKKGASHSPPASAFEAIGVTGRNGRVQFDGLAPMHYLAVLHHLRTDPLLAGTAPQCVEVRAGCMHDACFDVELNVSETPVFAHDDCTPTVCPREGDCFASKIEVDNFDQLAALLDLEPPPNTRQVQGEPLTYRGVIGRAGPQLYPWKLLAAYQQVFAGAPAGGARALLGGATAFEANVRTPQPVTGNLGVALSRTATASKRSAASRACRSSSPARARSSGRRRRSPRRAACASVKTPRRRRGSTRPSPPGCGRRAPSSRRPSSTTSPRTVASSSRSSRTAWAGSSNGPPRSP